MRKRDYPASQWEVTVGAELSHREESALGLSSELAREINVKLRRSLCHVEARRDCAGRL
jgi:hypothetical protein